MLRDEMGHPDRAAASRLRRPHVTSGALAASLAVCALAAYAGCSSSSSSPASPDAAVDSGNTVPPPDGGVDATADATPADSSSDVTAPTDQAAPSDAPPADDTGEAAGATVDCSNDEGGEGLPNDLACTGLYSDWASKTIAPQNVPYAPGYLLWSDNANKARFIYLPPGTQIDTSDMDNWVFPVGTKVWKQFSLGALRIETRLFSKTSSGWNYTTYRWTADGESGATQLEMGETNVNGTSYEIPAHGACLQCHGGRPDNILGFDVINLGTTSAVGVSLASLTAAGQLTTAPPASVEIPEDSSGHARASLGWLHSNCGVACHNSNSGALAAGTGLFLKTSGAQIIAGGGTVQTNQLDPYVTAVYVVPRMQPFASEGFYRIDPGHPANSLVPTLDAARNNPNIPQMPPIISHIEDTADVTALQNWITTMPIPDGGPPDAGGD
jgi:hypothetical protein